MKIAKNTRERIAHIKAESEHARQQLQTLLARLEEHPGTKRLSRKLVTAIRKLEEWQKEAA